MLGRFAAEVMSEEGKILETQADVEKASETHKERLWNIMVRQEASGQDGGSALIDFWVIFSGRDDAAWQGGETCRGSEREEASRGEVQDLPGKY